VLPHLEAFERLALLGRQVGGGYVASGPSTKSRLPLPTWPAELCLLGTEGAGEVQTPVVGKPPKGYVKLRTAPADQWNRRPLEHIGQTDLAQDDPQPRQPENQPSTAPQRHRESSRPEP
jgi:hypothetical protein